MLGPAFLALILLGGTATAQPGAPECTAESPLSGSPVELRVGQEHRFAAHCVDADGDLFWIAWSTSEGGGVAQHPATPTDATNRSYTYTYDAAFAQPGIYWVKAVPTDREQNRGAAVTWNVVVQDGDAREADGDGGRWSLPPVDPVKAFSAVVVAIVSLGGFGLAVARHRRRRAGDEAGGDTVTQSVGANAGTVIGHAQHVVVNHAPADVPAAVPPHKHGLYRSLARAHDALDRLPPTAASLEARESLGALMDRLARGEIPLREARRPAAAAVLAAIGEAERVLGEPAAQDLREAARDLGA